jgi:hypothetical protein
MLDKLFKVTVFAVLIAWLAWHYRDARILRENQVFVESGIVQSAWDDFLTRYNLIAQLRDRKSAVEQGPSQGDDTPKRSTTP